MGITTQQAHWIVHRAKTHVTPSENGCLIWRGPKNKAGYGLIECRDHISKERLSFGVHRIYYALIHKVELQRSDFICHKCDNPSCVNIDHLFLGNAKINSDDKISKGRYAKKIRYHHRHKKYSEAQILAAKDLLKLGHTMSEVARISGLAQSYIWNINWGKVKKDEGIEYPLMIPMSLKGTGEKIRQGIIKVTQ